MKKTRYLLAAALVLAALVCGVTAPACAAVGRAVRCELYEDHMTMFPFRGAYEEGASLIAAAYGRDGKLLFAKSSALGTYGETITVDFPCEIVQGTVVKVFLLGADGVPASRPYQTYMFTSGDIVTPEV